MTKLALLGIRAYQLLIAPVLPPCCRFEPTCSCMRPRPFDGTGSGGGRP